jgi:hypothetical protein
MQLNKMSERKWKLGETGRERENEERESSRKENIGIEKQ